MKRSSSFPIVKSISGALRRIDFSSKVFLCFTANAAPMVWLAVLTCLWLHQKGIQWRGVVFNRKEKSGNCHFNAMGIDNADCASRAAHGALTDTTICCSTECDRSCREFWPSNATSFLFDDKLVQSTRVSGFMCTSC